MKPFLFVFFLLLAATGSISAQNLIAVQNAGNPSFYNSINDAISSAEIDDTLYISGGTFETVSLDKRLILIGVGHHPDSTDVTAKTVIKGLYIYSGASGSLITGISIESWTVYFVGEINDLTISRCNLSGGFQFTTNPQSLVTNLSLIENIIGYNNLSGFCSGSFISNNIVTGCLTINNGIIKNNVFLYYSPYAYYPYSLYATNCQIENNVFHSTQPNGFMNCIFRNNVNFMWNRTDSYGNQGSGNFEESVSLQSVFVNYPETLLSIYQADFNFPAGSPYKNAGRDGTDIGIYGGAFPWKEGSIPFNPHFQQVQIAPKTDNQGNLNVNIRVKAQDH